MISVRKRALEGYGADIVRIIARHGAPLMSFGVVGGPMQREAHIQVVLRILADRQNPQRAIDAPRWRITDSKKVVVEWERRTPSSSSLLNRGMMFAAKSPPILSPMAARKRLGEPANQFRILASALGQAAIGGAVKWWGK